MKTGAKIQQFFHSPHRNRRKKIMTEVSEVKLFYDKPLIYFSWLSITIFLIMSVTLWQKSHKSFQIFQNRVVWFVLIWRISRQRRLNITVCFKFKIYKFKIQNWASTPASCSRSSKVQRFKIELFDLYWFERFLAVGD